MTDFDHSRLAVGVVCDSLENTMFLLASDAESYGQLSTCCRSFQYGRSPS